MFTSQKPINAQELDHFFWLIKKDKIVNKILRGAVSPQDIEKMKKWEMDPSILFANSLIAEILQFEYAHARFILLTFNKAAIRDLDLKQFFIEKSDATIPPHNYDFFNMFFKGYIKLVFKNLGCELDSVASLKQFNFATTPLPELQALYYPIKSTSAKEIATSKQQAAQSASYIITSIVEEEVVNKTNNSYLVEGVKKLTELKKVILSTLQTKFNHDGLKITEELATYYTIQDQQVQDITERVIKAVALIFDPQKDNTDITSELTTSIEGNDLAQMGVLSLDKQDVEPIGTVHQIVE